MPVWCSNWSKISCEVFEDVRTDHIFKSTIKYHSLWRSYRTRNKIPFHDHWGLIQISSLCIGEGEFRLSCIISEDGLGNWEKRDSSENVIRYRKMQLWKTGTTNILLQLGLLFRFQSLTRQLFQWMRRTQHNKVFLDHITIVQWDKLTKCFTITKDAAFSLNTEWTVQIKVQDSLHPIGSLGSCGHMGHDSSCGSSSQGSQVLRLSIHKHYIWS